MLGGAAQCRSASMPPTGVAAVIASNGFICLYVSTDGESPSWCMRSERGGYSDVSLGEKMPLSDQVSEAQVTASKSLSCGRCGAQNTGMSSCDESLLECERSESLPS